MPAVAEQVNIDHVRLDDAGEADALGARTQGWVVVFITFLGIVLFLTIFLFCVHVIQNRHTKARKHRRVASIARIAAGNVASKGNEEVVRDVCKIKLLKFMLLFVHYIYIGNTSLNHDTMPTLGTTGIISHACKSIKLLICSLCHNSFNNYEV